MNKDDIRIGLKKYSLIKNPIKWFQILRYKRKHKKLHNDNDLFYPTQPALLEAIIKAINIQRRGEYRLMDGYGYYEFGVFKGFSLWFAYMYSKLAGFDFKFYGFDSFEGLPKSKVDGIKPAFGKGHYSSSLSSVVEKLNGLNVDWNRIRLFKGFYSNEYFTGLKKQNNLKKASIVVIDVDIYESCVPVLEFIKDYLVKGSILLFDDYNLFNNSNEHGERRAFLEFKEKYQNYKFKKLFDFGYGGRAFEVIKI